jgi:short chain dehydrogenase
MSAQIDDWEEVMAIDGRGMFLTCKYAIEQMLTTGGGSIVCLSSISGVAGQARQSTYGPAKFVASGLTKHLAVEWASHGIRVNAWRQERSTLSGCSGCRRSRLGRSIWRRSKPHTRWEGCASRAKWPRQSCSLPPIKRPSSPAQYFPLTGDFWRSRRVRSSFALTATGQAIDQRQRLSCSADATRCLLPHRRSCLSAPRSARVRYPRSN